MNESNFNDLKKSNLYLQKNKYIQHLKKMNPWKRCCKERENCFEFSFKSAGKLKSQALGNSTGQFCRKAVGRQ